MNDNAEINMNNEEIKHEEAEKNEKSFVRSVFDFVSVIATAVIAVAFSFTFLFRTIGVVGNSMVPTLDNGDKLILTAFEYEPENGDIVVTCQPSGGTMPDTLVKRIIATEGQTVDIDFQNGIVYVDGVALDEPYINEPTLDPEDFYGEVTVPEGHVFIMGDNRNHSTDSRDNRVGFVKEEYIMGEVLFRAFPFGQFKV